MTKISENSLVFQDTPIENLVMKFLIEEKGFDVNSVLYRRAEPFWYKYIQFRNYDMCNNWL